MSSLWTPGGERPVDRPSSGGNASDDASDDAPAAADGPVDPEQAELDRMRQEMARQLVETPVDVIIRDHCAAFFQLAALHLDRQPPDLEQAAVAIDAMGALLDGLNGRIADEEALREALANLRLAFVQLRGSNGGEDERVPGEPFG